MGCLVGYIHRIGEGLQVSVTRLGSDLRCEVKQVGNRCSASISRIGEGLQVSVTRVNEELGAGVGAVCSVNKFYSCYGHGYWDNDCLWVDDDGWRNDDVIDWS